MVEGLVSAVWWVFAGMVLGAPIAVLVATLLVGWSRQEIEEEAYRRGAKDTMDRVYREKELRKYGP